MGMGVRGMLDGDEVQGMLEGDGGTTNARCGGDLFRKSHQLQSAAANQPAMPSEEVGLRHKAGQDRNRR